MKDFPAATLDDLQASSDALLRSVKGWEDLLVDVRITADWCRNAPRTAAGRNSAAVDVASPFAAQGPKKTAVLAPFLANFEAIHGAVQRARECA